MPTAQESYLSAYSEYSKTIRTWFVAYGIGAPALLLTNADLARALRGSGHVREIALLFLIGVGLQVALAAANKASMWGNYYGETKLSFKKTKRYAVGYWFSEQYWIDLSVDLLSFAAFALATSWVFLVVVCKDVPAGTNAT